MAKNTLSSEAKRQASFIKDAGLVGRTIVAVRYMTDKEVETMDWSCKSPILVLDNGDLLFPQKDDEGNDGGPLVVQKPDGVAILPVF